ncbi:MAG: haloalkane dehalogenase [Salinisphaera sp.]|nr:haloalkane dehalogenase [Salinisphaera sp.]
MAYTRQKIEVLDRQMAYVETGSGDPIVFLHGNPTSSYLWRNVIPHVQAQGRCIAPDLIGMGDSDKLADSGPERYRFVDHRRYLDALLERLGVERNVILVIHDWGSALGFDWARRNPERVAGICYMEAIVRPLTWAEWPADALDIFQAMRTQAGEGIVLEKNLFVERILPASIQRELSAPEMDEYRRPYVDSGEARRPTLTWPRQIPIEGEPADVVAIVEEYGRWLAGPDSPPKLFINGEPGMIIAGAVREYCRTWPRQEEVTVPGLHFLQEDSADAIGQAVARFVSGLRAG